MNYELTEEQQEKLREAIVAECNLFVRTDRFADYINLGLRGELPKILGSEKSFEPISEMTSIDFRPTDFEDAVDEFVRDELANLGAHFWKKKVRI